MKGLYTLRITLQAIEEQLRVYGIEIMVVQTEIHIKTGIGQSIGIGLIIPTEI